MTTINTITIREPYASLLAIGAKRIETRSWPAPSAAIGKPIAIHAAKGFTRAELDYTEEHQAMEMVLAPDHPHGIASVIWPAFSDRAERRIDTAFGATRGCVIATATLARCVCFRGAATLPGMFAALGCPPDEEVFGDFSPGRYGWVLTDVVRLAVPVPATGKLGLWTWEMPERVCKNNESGKITGTAQKLEATAPPLTVRLSHQEEANA